jgi:hypothetical protein
MHVSRRHSNGLSVADDSGGAKKVHKRKSSNFFDDGGPVLVEKKQSRIEKLQIVISSLLMRFNYFIERTLENQGSVFQWMFALLFLQIVVFGAAFGALSGSFGYEAFFWGAWDSWTFMADPGTHASTVETDGVARKLMSIFITFMGIFYFAVILALIVDWVRERMDSIKKGKGYIVETDHFLILGMHKQLL